MHDLITTLGLTLLCLLAAGLGITSWLGLQRSATEFINPRFLACRGYPWLTAGCGLLFLYRWGLVSGQWLPLEAHVDGLLLICTLLSMGLWYLQHHWRVPGVSLFALPLLVLLLAWAVCASRWTFYPFGIDSVWMFVHLSGVYLGTLGFVIAAGAGAMFLTLDVLLRRKRDPQKMRPMGSLEATEKLMIRSAALGFGMLSLGLVSGLIIVTSGPTAMGPGWWHSPKVLLGVLAWASYGLVMNVRHTANFRGTRAAILSIAGLVLLLSTLALALHLPGQGREQASTDHPLATPLTQEPR